LEIQTKKIINKTNNCECQLDNCLSCPSIKYTNIKVCTQCNNNSYFQKENNISNNGYIYCFQDPKGYYLDDVELIYKKCYITCDKCTKKGDNINHYCLECNNYYSNKIEKIIIQIVMRNVTIIIILIIIIIIIVQSMNHALRNILYWLKNIMNAPNIIIFI